MRTDAARAVHTPKRTPASTDVLGEHWSDAAACKGEDTELFFPVAEDQSIAEALALCAACPVRSQCLESALSRPERYGVFGGMSAPQRQLLRRRQGRAPQTKPRGSVCPRCGTTYHDTASCRRCPKCTRDSRVRCRDAKDARRRARDAAVQG